ncbi:hypothetical protein [Lacrimispora sp.]|jgi:hypothetical protein|uniref:hypothetical protein n=1 Tax=Lacrimispora sp. TaxID=2719234 RepID=UPI0028A6F14B|nr:hypothetical protein [Lacrimispora sp.]
MENRFCLQMVSCGDGCCGNGGTDNVYSTEETVCGKWIDGKPIYRKVISGTLAVENGNKHTFANVSDLKIDKVINLYGNLIDKNNLFQVALSASINRPEGMYAAVNMYYGMEAGNIYYSFLNNKGDYSGCAANVIIEYTKK